MEFKEFKTLFQNNFQKMTKDASHLFEVDLNKDELWNLYLESFPTGTNEVYRKRREYDCSCCRHFIKAIGNAVIIRDNQIITLWDIETGDSKFQPVVDALSSFVKSKVVSDIYVSKVKDIGVDKNCEYKDGKIVEWHHLYLNLPIKFVDTSSKSEGEIKGWYRDIRNVFKSSLEEISEDSISTVLELISQNSLYKGAEWEFALKEFLTLKKEYSKIKSQSEKDNYTWVKSTEVGGIVGKIKNHSIGMLLVNISEGMDLDEAVKKYESIVAPSNYKRPKAIYTKKMLEDVKKTIENLGYINSLRRRYATLNDITVNNILFTNKDSAKRISGGDIFTEMSSNVAINPKQFSKVEEITIEKFIEDVLPSAKEIETFLDNRLASNFVSLIAPEDINSKVMFKWDNPFSWAYSGNITDSMKERVKAAGGKVDGVLRFSIQWNDEEYNQNDFDAHCIEPKGQHIYFGNKYNGITTGNLDVDIIHPDEGKPAIENITWSNKSKMNIGTYQFYVHNYTHRGGRSGFKAEIEFNGQVYMFEYRKELRQGETIPVAEVTLSRDGTFTIKEKLKSNVSSKTIWNLNTNQFVPVSVVMYSPNYWDSKSGIGNKHYFFMLKDCINPEQPNGFYNEFLKEELMTHKRVLEALGSKLAVAAADDQLSGIGFSSTKRDEIIVKVKGQTERLLKIKF